MPSFARALLAGLALVGGLLVLAPAAVAGGLDEPRTVVALPSGRASAPSAPSVTDEAAPAATTGPAEPTVDSSQLAAVEPGPQVPVWMMYVGLAAAGAAVMVLVVGVVGGLASSKTDEVSRNIDAYTRKGAKLLAESSAPGDQPSGAPGMAAQAVAFAENMLGGNKGVEAALGARLEAAGLQLKPAEWLLIHVGFALSSGTFALLLSGGGVAFMVLGLLLGIALPWLYLGLKERRRTKAFKSQLADTLQLMAGSLSAGLSLAQAVSTVVNEGGDPIAGEFRRALVETRLGVGIEDALNGIAERMRSKDFEWVVMAIRIQREVGGNLAELLNNVAETIREREYLERQVLSLSAEGRLSVWILGGLPPGFMAYLFLANRTYLEPMYTTAAGVILLTVTVVLLLVGVFWMKKLVKVVV